MLNIWSILDFLLDQNVARYRNATGASVKFTLCEVIYGFEYKAVVEDRSPLKLKQTENKKTNGSWPSLIQEIDAVILFADGFEDLIIPAEEINMCLCRRWQRAPKERDYLTTSVKVLQQLYDEAGSRLSRKWLTSKSKIQWHQGGSMLFESGKSTLRCECDRLQQLFPGSVVGAVLPPNNIIKNDAVIFGRSSMASSFKSPIDAPQLSTLYSLPNIPFDPIMLRKNSNAPDLDTTTTTIPDDFLTPTSTKISQRNRRNAENSFQCSIDRAVDIIRQLDSEIYELSCEPNRRLQQVGQH